MLNRFPLRSDQVCKLRGINALQVREGDRATCFFRPIRAKKKLALIVHLNDAHHRTRERIAAWVADPDVPHDESHAHH